MLKQTFHSLALLYPDVLLEGWKIEKVSERYEGEKWESFWFQVVTPTGMFRVKEFFLDIMEPVFPDSCISQAKGYCFQYKGLVYWKGINYKGKESYVTSKWKTQIEISIDRGYVNKDEMERFLFGLQPAHTEFAKMILHTPFHLLSFQAKRGEMGEIGRCCEWNDPDNIRYVKLSIHKKLSWKLESVGFGNDEMQYVYWDEGNKLYALWVCRHKNKSYYPVSSWTKNYGVKQIINGLDFYSYRERGTVVYQDLGMEQIAYVFRGNPCTNFEQVKELFACL
ncbi:hypothetical protein COE01_18430 [Bacillus thuringiensis]|uniref:hypothetical protein n=1 Tax=Bacillus thuringiensis TaxID=1428 RepID=UPI000BF4AD60|nr:hypothetical protein [Bacillus thuringiensis]PFN50464.1 hypothetical protein COJ58_19985 [Bacillus thuringiensis]PGW79185.1 hypothetical protein COE01_18430 [Bacillus thuringiensis]PGZ39100.1 hypothetical protein COE52_19060 [Bacillus thuringiensis]